jgi:mono/diheme cytochrome c family protein
MAHLISARFLSPLLVVMAAAPSSAGEIRPAPSREATAGSATIDIWVRRAGATGSAEPASARDLARQISLNEIPLRDVERVDLQYHGAFTYRGVELAALIDGFAPPASTDLALLHFANGMQIPLAFRDTELVHRLAPFVARGIRLGPNRPMQIGRFPKVARAGDAVRDPRPIVFYGNKLVVADSGHPDVPPAHRAVLSPWALADTLTGIEFVSRAAYYAQFDVDQDPQVREGERLYTQSCQFCHGVRQTGAAFGWDFVDPTPIADYRHGRNFFLHVHYKPQDAVARGLRMPALSYMSEDEARLLWLWLRAVADHPLRPYRP